MAYMRETPRERAKPAAGWDFQWYRYYPQTKALVVNVYEIDEDGSALSQGEELRCTARGYPASEGDVWAALKREHGDKLGAERTGGRLPVVA